MTAVGPWLCMAGASVAVWLATSALGGPGANPEAFAGMLAPLASAGATWVAASRTFLTAPERLTVVMVAGFGLKMVFFAGYLTVMLRGLELRPVPLVLSLVAHLVVLYAIEAFFLRRLFAAGPVHASRR